MNSSCAGDKGAEAIGSLIKELPTPLAEVKQICSLAFDSLVAFESQPNH